jgi:CubicO group peptidase (beta-lactamase class C family)
MRLNATNPVLRCLLMLCLFGLLISAASQDQGSVSEKNDQTQLDSLAGLWKAHKRFDAYHQGPLLLNADDGWAEFAGQRVALVYKGERWTASFSSEHGEFFGRMSEKGPMAHWHQPDIIQMGATAASPVQFEAGEGRLWIGSVTPIASQFTFYLPMTPSAEGGLQTYLRNPERNMGVFAQIQRVELAGEALSLIGNFRGSDETQTLLAGRYYADADYFSLDFPIRRGGSYDFRRVSDPEESGFRARPPGEWRYQAPPALIDGWRTGTLTDVGLNAELIREMIETHILPADQDVHSLNVHGVLVARGGVLVLEEYFHGFHRDLPHDTRSAGKSLGSVLVGAAMLEGVGISPDTAVYSALGETPDGLDERKQAMRLEHLLTMSSGFYCDDGDGDAPGNENNLQSQNDQPDWYRYILDLPMAEAPGETAIYCSVNSNLIGAVVSALSQRPLTELVQTLVAEPLQISSYHLNLQPTGEPYLGGGSHWRARDYMKLVQMMLDGGRWNGTQVVSEQWARESTQARVRIGERGYGRQWWVNEYDWHGETVEAFFAAGNGGQIFMGIPAADLVIAFWGGNYSDQAGRLAQSVLIPEYILAATPR